MLGAALGLAGTGVVYLLARMASGGLTVKRDTTVPLPLPTVPRAPAPPPASTKPAVPAPLPVPEPPMAEEPPPRPAPPPPIDTPAASVPTPSPAPSPVPAAPPPPVNVQAPAPGPVVTPPAPQPLPVPEPAPAPEPVPVAPPPPPADVPSASVPTPNPNTGMPPAGFDPSEARALAPRVASSVRTKSYDYDRALTKRFQLAAGIAVDGIYGGETWGAVDFYAPGAPKAILKPLDRVAYVWASQAGGGSQVGPIPPPVAAVAPPPDTTAPAAPQSSAKAFQQPPAGYDPAKARKMAKQVTANLDSKQRAGYSRPLLKEFQLAAGLVADGIYGGGSRGALIAYGIARPPQPFFKPTETAPYPWATS